MLKSTQKVCKNMGLTYFFKRRIFFGSGLASLGHCMSLPMARGAQCLYIANKAAKNPKCYEFLHGSVIYVSLVLSLGYNAKMCEHFIKVIAFIVIQDQNLILFFFFHCTIVQNKFTRSRFLNGLLESCMRSLKLYFHNS